MKLLSKLFGYSKNRKNISRELLNESKSEKTENKENKKRRRFMENEKNSVNEEVKTQDTNTESTENVKDETKEETKTEVNSVEDGKDKDVPTKEDGSEQPVQDAQQDVPTTQPGQVQETQGQGNGVRVEDLVTKDELAERFAALEAKYDAVIKENQDLKNKYENKDFGTYQKQGLLPQDETQKQYESFDAYSKKFMQ